MRIKCPNCGYTGKGKSNPENIGGFVLIMCLLFIASFIFIPLIIIPIIMLSILIFKMIILAIRGEKGMKQVCPDCGYIYVIPI